jgi:hypothetical protein
LKFFKKNAEIGRKDFRGVENYIIFRLETQKGSDHLEGINVTLRMMLQTDLRAIWRKVQSGLERLGILSSEEFLWECNEPSASINSGDFFSS